MQSPGELLPVVGLGTWARFDVEASPPARRPLPEVLENMAAIGGKLIDSSPMYGNAEEVIGDLTAESGLADRFFYATKVWTSGEENGIRQNGSLPAKNAARSYRRCRFTISSTGART